MVLVWWNEVAEIQRVSRKCLNDKRDYEVRALTYTFETERALRATVIHEMVNIWASDRSLSF